MLQHGGLPGEARVGEVLDLVRRSFPAAWPLEDLVVTAGIEGLLARPVDALSGGQRQRVPLALALAGAPPLLLLDEPTSAMDVEGRRAFWTTMRGLADRGHTVVFATHHLDEADAVADRVVVIADGRVIADGSAADVKSGVAGRTISFTAAAERGLDGLPAVSGVTRQGGTVTLATTDAAVTLRALLSDGGLPDLEVRGASLEDAVLSLISTGRNAPVGAVR
jgi:ABC-2 type transport system ATP-binding protein